MISQGDALTADKVKDDNVFFTSYKGKYILMDNLDEIGDMLVFHRTALVLGTVVRKRSFDVEQIDGNCITPVGKHPRDCKGIATIVAWTSKDHHRSESGPSVGDCLSDCCGGTLHQVDGANGLMINGIFVELVNLCAIKYLHR